MTADHPFLFPHCQLWNRMGEIPESQTALSKWQTLEHFFNSVSLTGFDIYFGWWPSVSFSFMLPKRGQQEVDSRLFLCSATFSVTKNICYSPWAGLNVSQWRLERKYKGERGFIEVQMTSCSNLIYRFMMVNKWISSSSDRICTWEKYDAFFF